VYENGSQVAGAPTSTYTVGDILRVAVENGYVNFYKNGDLVYANPNPVITPFSLSVDASIRTIGGRISNAFISGTNMTPTATATITSVPTNTPAPTATCSPSGWCTRLSLNQGTGSNVLNAVAVLDASNIWAVGGYDVVGQTGKSLIEYWDGSNWHIQDAPDVGILRGVAAADANHVWAIGVPARGDTSKGDSDILFNDGGNGGNNWQPVSSARGGGGKAIAALAPDDVWTVGSAIQHFDGRNWSIFTIPDGGSNVAISTLNGLAVVDSDTAWAVGYREEDTGNRRPVIVRATCVNGGDACSWSEEPGPILNGAWLNGISKPDQNQRMWAVGSRYDPGTDKYVALIETWDGTSWTSVDLSSCAACNPGSVTNELHSVWYSSQGDVWAAGEYRSTTASGSGSLMLHWSNNAWSRVVVPNPGVQESNSLLGVGAAPGAPGAAVSVWAVGSYVPYQGAPSQTLVEYLPPTPSKAGATSGFRGESEDEGSRPYEASIEGGVQYDLGCERAPGRKGESGTVLVRLGPPGD
jgi:hypothetical protein